MNNNTKYTMDTLPGKLRVKAAMISMGERIEWGSDSALMYEAAANIEALEKRIKELEGRASKYPQQICNDVDNRHSLSYAIFSSDWCQGCNPGNCSGCSR